MFFVFCNKLASDEHLRASNNVWKIRKPFHVVWESFFMKVASSTSPEKLDHFSFSHVKIISC